MLGWSGNEQAGHCSAAAMTGLFYEEKYQHDCSKKLLGVIPCTLK